MDYESCVRIAFSLDENQVAVFSGFFVTLWDTNNPENCLSFYSWPTKRHFLDCKVALQTSNHMVIYIKLQRDDHCLCLLSPGLVHNRSYLLIFFRH